MTSWTEPLIGWQFGVDSRDRHASLLAEAEKLTTWPAAPADVADTDCFRLRSDYWIWQPGLGGLQILADRPALTAFPAPDVPIPRFERLLTRSWLPAIYPVWGRQVVHASAVIHDATGGVLAFVGPSGAGKSTFAFGLGQRAGWRHLSDDSLAFSVEAGQVRLHPLPNEVRLRPASAAHFNRSGLAPVAVRWPDGGFHLERFCFLDGTDQIDQSESDAVFGEVAPGATYQRLLEQAFAMSLAVPDLNRRLMIDYLAIADVPAFRLTYRRALDRLDTVFDGIERYLR